MFQLPMKVHKKKYLSVHQLGLLLSMNSQQNFQCSEHADSGICALPSHSEVADELHTPLATHLFSVCVCEIVSELKGGIDKYEESKRRMWW